MTQYRDETETLRARVTELEGKLVSAEAEAARLRGETSTPVLPEAQRDGVVGEPLHFVSELELPFQLSEAGYEAIASLVRVRRHAQVAQVGRSLTAPGFSLTAGEGWTRIRLETDLRGLRASAFAGPVLTGLFAGLPAVGVVLDMSSHWGTSPLHLAWLLPSVLAGGFVGMRALARRRATLGRAEHEGVFAGLRELADAHRVPDATATKVRVEAPPEEAEEDAATAREPEAERAQRRP